MTTDGLDPDLLIAWDAEATGASDAEVLRMARTAVPRLVAEVERLRAELAEERDDLNDAILEAHDLRVAHGIHGPLAESARDIVVQLAEAIESRAMTTDDNLRGVHEAGYLEVVAALADALAQTANLRGQVADLLPWSERELRRVAAEPAAGSTVFRPADVAAARELLSRIEAGEFGAVPGDD